MTDERWPPLPKTPSSSPTKPQLRTTLEQCLEAYGKAIKAAMHRGQGGEVKASATVRDGAIEDFYIDLPRIRPLQEDQEDRDGR